MKTRFLLPLVLISGMSQHAMAADASHCLKIEDPDARLGCYDMEYGKTSSTEQTAGDWVSHTETNPLDDSSTVLLVLESESGTNRRRQSVKLAIRCKSNTTDMWIIWGDYLGNDMPSVTTRLGQEDAKTDRWSLSTNNTSTFYPGSPIGLLKEMMSETRYVAQITPYNESPITAVFNISGLEEAIGPLRKTCNW